MLPFQVSGGPDYQYLGPGLVDLLTTRMDGIGSIRTVPTRAVLGLLDQESAGSLDRAAVERVTASLGAGRYVQGRVVASGGRLSVTAGLYERGTPDPVTEASVEGDDEDLFGTVDELTSRLVAGLEASPGGRVRQLAALTTSSIPALKAYLRGEELLRAGQFTQALASFEQASALDSTFALAHYRESIAREWGSQQGVTEAARAALRHADRLSERDRLLVEAMAAWRTGDADRAEDLYRTVLGIWPDDVEAWLQLAEVLNHYGPLRGGSVSESREAFERVLRYEPDHLLSLWHLSRIEVLEGNRVAAADIVARIRELSPEGDRTLELMAMEAADGPEARWAPVRDALMDAQDITRYFAVWNVAVFAERLDRARELVAALREPSRSTEVRATGNLQDAFLALAQGRRGEARAAMDRVEALDPDMAVAHGAALALLPFVDTPAGELERHHAAVTAWRPRSGCLSDHSVRGYEPNTCIRPLVRAYLLGVLEARLGRAEPALARVDSLDAWSDEGRDQGHGEELAAAVRVEVLLERGDSAGALAIAEGLSDHVFYIHALESFFYSHAPLRFRRAQLLEAAGRSDDALRWYSSFDDMALYDLVMEAAASLRAARLLEAGGRPGDAAVRYADVDRFLDGAEEPFAGWEAEARAALARLREPDAP